MRLEDIRSITKVEDVLKKVRYVVEMGMGRTYDKRQQNKMGQNYNEVEKYGWMTLKKVEETIWSRKAKDRDEWKKLKEAYVS